MCWSIWGTLVDDAFDLFASSIAACLSAEVDVSAMFYDRPGQCNYNEHGLDLGCDPKHFGPPDSPDLSPILP